MVRDYFYTNHIFHRFSRIPKETYQPFPVKNSSLFCHHSCSARPQRHVQTLCLPPGRSRMFALDGGKIRYFRAGGASLKSWKTPQTASKLILNAPSPSKVSTLVWQRSMDNVVSSIITLWTSQEAHGRKVLFRRFSASFLWRWIVQEQFVCMQSCHGRQERA